MYSPPVCGLFPLVEATLVSLIVYLLISCTPILPHPGGSYSQSSHTPTPGLPTDPAPTYASTFLLSLLEYQTITVHHHPKPESSGPVGLCTLENKLKEQLGDKDEDEEEKSKNQSRFSTIPLAAIGELTPEALVPEEHIHSGRSSIPLHTINHPSQG
ncbi:hypothetical protein KQX54_016474 [Cotesia glomerata]|uniref:Uncharacterized protein n=1 Tax=Cotesia glomerata TaxID=32391 RepID=A0AAV7HYL2_COTGL|nr:hypothetical protein KQX54_016474 [Cotesia glomerata]